MAKEPTQLPFNEAKVTQAAALLLALRGGRMHYLKLIKLLYIADRTALQRWGVPITMDRYVAMDHGPVVSRTFNLIQGFGASTWSQFISDPMGEHEVELHGNPGTSLLSAAEEKLLHEIFQQWGHRSRWALVEETHHFAEWHDPHGSSAPITIGDILRALGETEESIAHQLTLLANASAAQSRFASHECSPKGAPSSTPNLTQPPCTSMLS